jgi:hypothetical protein
MSRLIATALFALLSAQVRIEARLGRAFQKNQSANRSRADFPIPPLALFRHLGRARSSPHGYPHPPGGRLPPRPPEESELPPQPRTPQLRAVSNPESLKKESALGYPTTKYRLRLSDGSELTFAWTKAVSFDWRPWQQRLRDPLLSAILGAGFTEGLPLSWEHRSAQDELLSRWHIERVDTLQPDPFAGILPTMLSPLKKP